MYRKDRIPLKTLIMEGSSRLKECLAHTSDDALEEKAILNEFYRCCIHSWSNKEDSILWERHSIAMTIRSYREEDGLNKEGWQYVQSKGMKMLGHIAPISFLKARYAETRRRQDGSVELIVNNPTADINRCILYKKWDSMADAFLASTYDNLIYWPGKKRKQFLDASDWQCVQHWFRQKFGCCPTQTQLQARTRIVLSKR
ncbi:hypothetical protein IEQ34_005619 [Dendrobium chrysotoxum]|uniref:Uncharacterized protein n=1 Tax=Dendrobium chrysotoxum TaxID=161865 RepID=A0AAV7HAB7_DENCH|nr:hypothetical protein IEQ34_005619 [Dendrobium chrysotoxum]